MWVLWVNPGVGPPSLWQWQGETPGGDLGLAFSPLLMNRCNNPRHNTRPKFLAVLVVTLKKGDEASAAFCWLATLRTVFWCGGGGGGGSGDNGGDGPDSVWTVRKGWETGRPADLGKGGNGPALYSAIWA